MHTDTRAHKHTHTHTHNGRLRHGTYCFNVSGTNSSSKVTTCTRWGRGVTSSTARKTRTTFGCSPMAWWAIVCGVGGVINRCQVSESQKQHIMPVSLVNMRRAYGSVPTTTVLPICAPMRMPTGTEG
jgi:hypothetical protein